jgi:hypothetical protein
MCCVNEDLHSKHHHFHLLSYEHVSHGGVDFLHLVNVVSRNLLYEHFSLGDDVEPIHLGFVDPEAAKRYLTLEYET